MLIEMFVLNLQVMACLLCLILRFQAASHPQLLGSALDLSTTFILVIEGEKI